MRACLFTAVLAALILPSLCSPAGAHDPWAWFRKPHGTGPANSPATENRYTQVPPGHERFYAKPVPAYGWLSNGFQVPTYNYGYFGAHFRPTEVEQHSYYNDYHQYSFRPGW